MSMELAVGRLYEAEDGTFGFCTQSDGERFGIAFVAPDHEPHAMMTYRIYRHDGTQDDLPSIVKELWRLESMAVEG